MLLEQVAHYDQAIEQVSERIEEKMRPFVDEVRRLDTIPGVDQRTAECLLAELGPDMMQFPSEKHLASWAGMCPGNNEGRASTSPARHARATTG